VLSLPSPRPAFLSGDQVATKKNKERENENNNNNKKL
jgi:hypothetical protein